MACVSKLPRALQEADALGQCPACRHWHIDACRCGCASRRVPVTPPVSLRRATEADAARLYAWRMEPSTLAASRECRTIDFADHLRWLNRSLGDPGRRLFVVWQAEHRIGAARLDLTAHGVELSLTLAPSARGAGRAVPVIQALVEDAADAFAPQSCLAEVRQSNHASLRAFWEAGFRVWAEAPPMVNHAGFVMLRLPV